MAIKNKTVDLSATFPEIASIPKNAKFPLAREPGADTPKLDVNYKFRPEMVKLGLLWISGQGPKGKNLSLYGPTGSGKTSFVYQLCARLGIEVMAYSASGHGEQQSLVGKLVLRGGEMTFEEGILPSAMRRGAVLLIDEVDLLAPDEAAGLNRVLDGLPLDLPDGTGGQFQVEPDPGFRIAVTSNTGGRGDRQRRYSGAKRHHFGFLDRFRRLHVPYMEKLVELDVLRAHVPNLPGADADTMLGVADGVRRQFMAEELGITISTRTLIQWAMDYTVNIRAGMKGDETPTIDKRREVLKETLIWSLPVTGEEEDELGVLKILDLHMQ